MEKTRLGIVGVGRWAHAHAHAAARSSDVEIVSCFGRNPDRRTAFAEEFGIEKTSNSFESMLADDEIDALVISTPNDLHVDMGIAAVEAGKPALLDKPVSVDVASGLRLLRVAADGKKIGVAHHPDDWLGIVGRSDGWPPVTAVHLDSFTPISRMPAAPR